MPGRSRKKKEDTEPLPSEETTEMTSTENEAEEAPAPTENAVEEIQVTIGVAPPTRTREGAGRRRQPNPFDEHIEPLFRSGEWGAVEFNDEEDKNNRRNQVKNAVKAHNDANDTSYGVEFGVGKEAPNVLKFHVKEKVEGRGRKPGSKKIDGHFYRPDEMDSEGNPTDEARAAKENSSASAAAKVDE